MERMDTDHRNSLEEKPEFFKVLIGDFKQRLMIPPAFIKHISQETSEKVILEGPSGDKWEAKLKRTTNGTFLEDGWERFSRDHSLRFGEFVVFRYNGDMHFITRIFARNACWREDSFAIKSSLESACGEKRKRGRPNLTPTKGKAWEAAKSFSSEKPYFSIEIRGWNVNKLGFLIIPDWFAKSYLPRERKDIHLQNEGKKWPVGFVPYPKKALLSTGWLPFSSENNLKKGDCCAFELVDELDMKVHVFRGSSC